MLRCDGVGVGGSKAVATFNSRKKFWSNISYVQAVVGSIVWAFRRLKKTRSREMNVRVYVLHSACPNFPFFPASSPVSQREARTFTRRVMNHAPIKYTWKTMVEDFLRGGQKILRGRRHSRALPLWLRAHIRVSLHSVVFATFYPLSGKPVSTSGSESGGQISI